MSEPSEPQREPESTYFVQDRENLEEMTRLEIQDAMLTTGMGGVLPELDAPTTLRSVLDVGCGTGGWLLETAKTYPMIEQLVGVDLSPMMTTHAREKAKAEGLDARVEFQTMDALRSLELPSSSFDLVNQRAATSWLRTWEWATLFAEYKRVSRPGGIIRVTENAINVASNSSALTKLWDMSREAFYRSGRVFTFSEDGVIGQLVDLLTVHGMRDVKSRVHTLVYQAGTQAGHYFYQDMLHGFRVALPFFQMWTRVESDYEEIYQQALKEMRSADFVATMTFLTAWGNTPGVGDAS